MTTSRRHYLRKCSRFIRRLLYRRYDPNISRRTLSMFSMTSQQPCTSAFLRFAFGMTVTTGLHDVPSPNIFRECRALPPVLPKCMSDYSVDEFATAERKSQNLADEFNQAIGSSVYSNNPIHYPAYAVDGYLSPRIWGEECFTSSIELSPWIQIDLQTISDIDFLKIFNRWDELGSRLHDIKIQIDDVGGKCDDYVGPAADSQVVFIPCLLATRGRHVKVYIDGAPGENNILTISELEIRQFN